MNKAVKLSSKKDVANWKLSTAIAALLSRNIVIPSSSIQINNNIQNGVDISEETILSAYSTCVGDNLSLMKQIDRLAYLRYELLSLLEILPQNKIEDSLHALIEKTLYIIPEIDSGFVHCESLLRSSIHRLLPKEQLLVKTSLYSNSLRLRKGELSNHVFHLVKLGRTTANPEDRLMFEILIENQIALIHKLVDGFEGKTNVLAKRILKVAHWQPKDLEEALKIHLEIRELLLMPFLQ